MWKPSCQLPTYERSLVHNNVIVSGWICLAQRFKLHYAESELKQPK
jgi:hypothetical protein